MDPNAVHAVKNRRVVYAVCSLDCPDSCGVLVTVEGSADGSSERAVKMQGDPTHPVTQGFLCGNVAKYLDPVYATDRLLYPMRRRLDVPKGPLAPGREAEAFERTSWDEALDLSALKLGRIASDFGPESILPFSYAGTIGQFGYGSMDRRFFYRLGASQTSLTPQRRGVTGADAGAARLGKREGVRKVAVRSDRGPVGCRVRRAVTLRDLRGLVGWCGALAILLGCFAPGHANAQRTGQLPIYRAQSWQSDSGLPQNTVHAVIQTADGFLWLGTEGGMLRFDGFRFKLFDTANTPQMRSDLVDGLAEDAAGALWVATSGGLLEMQGGRFRAFAVADGLPSDVVTGIYRQGSRLVIATANGLAERDGGGFREIAGTEILSEAAEIHVLPGEDGTLWVSAGQRLIAVRADSHRADAPVAAHVGTINALGAGADGVVWVGGAEGLACLRQDRRSKGRLGGAGPEMLLPHEDITALVSGKDGALWVGMASGLKRVKDHQVRAVAGGENAGAVQRLYAAEDGTVWVAFSKGIGRVVGDAVEMIAPLAPGDRVLALVEDREGDVWVGSEANGLTVLRVQPFRTLTTQDGLSADFVRTVFQERAGTVLIGTDKGGLDEVIGGKVRPLPGADGLENSVVLALAETGDDIWVGTPDGLTRLQAGRLRTFTTEDGLPDSFVRSLFADRDGTLWVGTRGGLAHEVEGRFESYTTRDGLGSDVVGSVLRTRDGVLWVGTLGGLGRLDGTKFVNFPRPDGLAGDAVTELFEDAEGTLWIATNGSGLTRLRGGHFTVVDMAKAGLPLTVYGMVEDSFGHLWMSSKEGIYRVAAAALNRFADGDRAALAVERFGAADGMRIGESSGGGHPAAWRMRDGTLWFATLKGVASVDPQSLVDGGPPPVVVERVLLDGQESTGTGNGDLVVPAGRGRLAIEYAGLSFAAPAKVRYRYRLEGFDHAWVDAGATRTALYTNVPPGRYRFVVEASKQRGAWSNAPAELRLRVRPRFFETWWFDMLVAVALLLLGYSLYRLRVRFVEARLKGVMAERGRIAREIHDTLAQGYVGISVQLEIASALLGLSDAKETAAARAQLEETKALVRSGLEEARSSIWDLRGEQAGAEILPVRLKELTMRRRGAGSPEVTVSVHGAYRALPGKVEDEIVRVAQEAVANACRHADAAQVAVSLTYNAGGGVAMRVLDDGAGFDTEMAGSLARKGHFGLQGMRERARAIGAELSVESSPGSGTAVQLQVNAEKRS